MPPRPDYPPGPRRRSTGFDLGGLGLPRYLPPAPETTRAARLVRERRQARRRRRRRVGAGVLASVLLAFGLSGGYVASVAIPSLPAGSVSLNYSPSLPPTSAPANPVGSQAKGVAIEVEGWPGASIFSHADTPLPMASLTKTITALMLVEKYALSSSNPGPVFTFGRQDVDIYSSTLAQDGSVAPVTAGLKLNLRQALVTMLLPSANNYAESLTLRAWGSNAKFLEAAKLWLGSNGLSQTRIYDPSGMDDANVSTPREVMRLARLVHKNPVLAPIVSLKEASIPGVGRLENTNTALWGNMGIDGVKTGTSPKAGANLAFSGKIRVADRNLDYYGAIMGAATHPVLYARLKNLVEEIRSSFTLARLAEKGESVGQYITAWGKPAPLVLGESLVLLIDKGSSISYKELLETGPKSTAAGSRMGQIVYELNSKQYPVPIVLKESVKPPDLAWRLTNPIKVWGG